MSSPVRKQKPLLNGRQRQQAVLWGFVAIVYTIGWVAMDYDSKHEAKKLYERTKAYEGGVMRPLTEEEWATINRIEPRTPAHIKSAGL